MRVLHAVNVLHPVAPTGPGLLVDPDRHHAGRQIVADAAAWVGDQQPEVAVQTEHIEAEPPPEVINGWLSNAAREYPDVRVRPTV